MDDRVDERLQGGALLYMVESRAPSITADSDQLTRAEPVT
jgi:hypothetical protein